MESAFRRLFRNSSRVRVLDFLIQGHDFDYTQTEVSDGADVNWMTLQKIWPVLEKSKIVVFTRAIGRGRLYKFNKENQVVSKLLELDFIISKQAIENELKEQEAIQVNI